MSRKRWWSWHDKKSNRVNKWGRGRRNWWSWHEPKRRSSKGRNSSSSGGFFKSLSTFFSLLFVPFTASKKSNKRMVVGSSTTRNSRSDRSKIKQTNTTTSVVSDKSNIKTGKKVNCDRNETKQTSLRDENVLEQSVCKPSIYEEYLKQQSSGEISEFEKSIGFGSVRNAEVCEKCGNKLSECACVNKSPLPFENHTPDYFSGLDDNFFN